MSRITESDLENLLDTLLLKLMNGAVKTVNIL